MKLSVIKPLCAMIASLLMCLAFSIALPSKGENYWAKQQQLTSHGKCHQQEYLLRW